MSGTNDSGISVTELSDLNSDINIVSESPAGQDHDDNNHTTVISTYTRNQKADAQYLQASRNTKPLRKEACESDEANDKTVGPSLTSIPVEVFTTERIAKALKCQLIATLIITICIIGVLSVVPVVLYTMNPPHAGIQSIEVDAFQRLNFDTCSVNDNKSQIELSLVYDDMMKFCNFTDADCEFNTTAIIGLHSVYGLGLKTNSQCVTDSTLSFFCNATLLLCNGDSSSVSLTEECEKVRDNNCSSEWRLIENFYNISVPDCISYDKDTNITLKKAPNQPCPANFDHFCNSTCLPVCGEYSLLTQDSSSNFSLYLAVAAGFIGLIGGIITLIICYYRRNKLLKFPQIYIVYNTVIWEVYLFLNMIPLVAEKMLMCSDHKFLESTKEPTYSCQIQGFMVQLLYSCFVGFWCFHLLHLFLSLAFPFKIKLWLDSSSFRNKIHLIEVTIVMLFGLLYPVLTISTTKPQYYYNGWYCAAVSASIVFYGGILPRLIVFSIGLVFLFASLWILRKKHHLKSSNITVSNVFCLGCSYSVGEVKLGLLFCYYMVTLLLYFTASLVHLTTRDEVFAKMAKYIYCSAGGHREECNKYKTLVTAPSVMTAVAVMLFLLINLCHLMYVIHIQTVKETITKLFTR